MSVDTFLSPHFLFSIILLFLLQILLLLSLSLALMNKHCSLATQASFTLLNNPFKDTHFHLSAFVGWLRPTC